MMDVIQLIVPVKVKHVRDHTDRANALDGHGLFCISMSRKKKKFNYMICRAVNYVHGA